jgi:serine/threonine protein kinase
MEGKKQKMDESDEDDYDENSPEIRDYYARFDDEFIDEPPIHENNMNGVVIGRANQNEVYKSYGDLGTMIELDDWEYILKELKTPANENFEFIPFENPDEWSIQTFIKEVTLLRLLKDSKYCLTMSDHPSYELYKRQLIIFFPYMEKTLDSWLEDQESDIPLNKANLIVKQIAYGLDEIHSLGWSHNDIHLGNVMVNDNITELKIIDFNDATRYKGKIKLDAFPSKFVDPEGHFGDDETPAMYTTTKDLQLLDMYGLGLIAEQLCSDLPVLKMLLCRKNDRKTARQIINFYSL